VCRFAHIGVFMCVLAPAVSETLAREAKMSRPTIAKAPPRHACCVCVYRFVY